MSKELIDVRMPDGTIIRGVPAGTSQAEVSRRYALMTTTPPPAQSVTQDLRTPGQVAIGQMEQIPKGIGELAGGLWNTAKTALSAATLPSPLREASIALLGKRAIQETPEAIARPYITTGRGLRALTEPVNPPQRSFMPGELGLHSTGAGRPSAPVPTREEFEEAGRGAGAQLAAAIAPPLLKPLARPLAKPAQYLQERARYAQDRPLILAKPEGHLQNALKTDMPADQLKVAGSDLKAGEARIGKPVKDIDTAREAARAQFEKELYPQRRQLIDPQKDVIIKWSQQHLIDAKIKDIPESVRLEDPALYRQLSDEIRSSFGAGDLTLGELEALNTSLNAINRTYHQAKFSGQLTKLETIKGSGDVALENATRRIMADGMDEQGIGGSGVLKNLNARIGNLIKVQDAIDSIEIQARTEAAQSRLGRLTQEAGQAIGTRFQRKIPGVTNIRTINEEIAAAMRKWKGQPPRFDMTRQFQQQATASIEAKRAEVMRDVLNRDPITGELLMPVTTRLPSMAPTVAERLKASAKSGGGERGVTPPELPAAADVLNRHPITGELLMRTPPGQLLPGTTVRSPRVDIPGPNPGYRREVPVPDVARRDPITGQFLMRPKTLKQILEERKKRANKK